MKVTVTDVYEERARVFNGTPEEVRRDLWNSYHDSMGMFYSSRDSLQDYIERLGHIQTFVVNVQYEAPITKGEDNLMSDGLEPDAEIVRYMHGYLPHLEAAFEAAKFLVNGSDPAIDSVRRALWDSNGDVVKAALRAYGIEDTEDNRNALEAVLNLSGLAKSDSPALPPDLDVEAALGTGQGVAEAVRRAVQAGQAMSVHLGGKHSKGSVVARDLKDQKNYLLKPGSGGQSTASGARDDSSSQSQREAAFYAVARLWGVGDDFPHCELLLINGEQYACMDLLGWDYKPMEKLKEKDPAEPARDFEPYRQKGLLHKWAVLDAVLGNPDRHAANIMASPSGDDVKLIDHGSAFAGRHFDPAHDRNSFIPYYLRYVAPDTVSFNALQMKDKLRYMATAPPSVRPALKEWILSLHADQLETVLPKYGIDPKPSVERLTKIKQIASGMSLDEAINRFWTGV